VRALLAAAAAAALLALAAPGASAQSDVTVAVGDIYFCASDYQGGVCDTEITVGDTVVWDFAGATLPHTTTACGASCDAPTASPLWNSGVLTGSGTFAFTFDEPGNYAYYCQIHPALQRGRIIVADDATPLPPVDLAAPPTSTPGPGLPPGGQGPATSAFEAALLAIAAATGLAGVSAIALSRLVRKS
jgi:plastocyanin